MNYIKLPGMDSEVSIFAIAQAHAQLESDYNKGGIVIERPSNARRNESTSCQLSRLRFASREWVEIVAPDAEDDTDGSDAADVRDIYLQNVLAWGLPIDAEMMAFIKTRYVESFWSKYPQCAGADYLQGN